LVWFLAGLSSACLNSVFPRLEGNTFEFLKESFYRIFWTELRDEISECLSLLPEVRVVLTFGSLTVRFVFHRIESFR